MLGRWGSEVRERQLEGELFQEFCDPSDIFLHGEEALGELVIRGCRGGRLYEMAEALCELRMRVLLCLHGKMTLTDVRRSRLLIRA